MCSMSLSPLTFGSRSPSLGSDSPLKQQTSLLYDIPVNPATDTVTLASDLYASLLRLESLEIVSQEPSSAVCAIHVYSKRELI